jgi:4-oxalocrotonate tautomerase
MSMPSRGRTKEQKRALIKDTTDAVVKDFDVTADAVPVEIIESSRDNRAKGGVLFSERRAASADLPEISSLRSASRVRCLPSPIDLLGRFGLCRINKRPLPSDGSHSQLPALPAGLAGHQHSKRQRNHQ